MDTCRERSPFFFFNDRCFEKPRALFPWTNVEPRKEFCKGLMNMFVHIPAYPLPVQERLSVRTSTRYKSLPRPNPRAKSTSDFSKPAWLPSI